MSSDHFDQIEETVRLVKVALFHPYIMGLQPMVVDLENKRSSVRAVQWRVKLGIQVRLEKILLSQICKHILVDLEKVDA